MVVREDPVGFAAKPRWRRNRLYSVAKSGFEWPSLTERSTDRLIAAKRRNVPSQRVPDSMGASTHEDALMLQLHRNLATQDPGDARDMH